MKTKKNYLMLAIFLVTLGFYTNAQDLMVCKDKEVYKLKNQLDLKEIKQFKDASECIQYGISLLPEGGEVLIQSGKYILSSQIDVTSKVALRGKGRGTKLVTSSKHNTGIAIMAKTADEVVIADLSVYGNENVEMGVVLDDAGDCKVFNVTTQGFNSYGIVVKGNSFLCAIENCSSADNAKANYYFDHNASNGRGGEYMPITVDNCMAYGGGNGYETNYSIVLNLVNCVACNCKENGFYIRNVSNSVLVSGCRTYQNGKHSILVESSAELNVSSCNITWNRGHGIYLDNVQWATIAANNIIDTGVRTADGSYTNAVTITNKSQGVQVTGNAIFNWGDQAPMLHGVYEDETCSNNLISSNNINYFTEKDVVSKGKNTIVKNNVAVGDSAFVGMGRKPYPDFNLDKIETFIKKNYVAE